MCGIIGIASSKPVSMNIINSLKKPGNPIIIYALPQEAEAIFYACKNEGVNVSAFCDNEKRKSNKVMIIDDSNGGGPMLSNTDEEKK